MLHPVSRDFIIYIKRFKKYLAHHKMPSKNKCQYCGKVLSSKSSLQNHIRTAKYCISKRGNVKGTAFSCTGCNKTYTSKYNLEQHAEKCVSYRMETQRNAYETIIRQREQDMEQMRISYEEKLRAMKEEYEEKIVVLQDKIVDIAMGAVTKPTTTNNTTNVLIQNLEPITMEHIREHAENLDITHILRGPKGYADFALEFPLRNRIVCVDYARKKIKFKDQEGNVIEDPKMTKITTKLFKGIRDRNSELINEWLEEYGEDHNRAGSTLHLDLQKCMNMVRGGANGEKNPLYHRFVEEVCARTRAK